MKNFVKSNSELIFFQLFTKMQENLNRGIQVPRVSPGWILCTEYEDFLWWIILATKQVLGYFVHFTSV